MIVTVQDVIAYLKKTTAPQDSGAVNVSIAINIFEHAERQLISEYKKSPVGKNQPS